MHCHEVPVVVVAYQGLQHKHLVVVEPASHGYCKQEGAVWTRPFPADQVVEAALEEDSGLYKAKEVEEEPCWAWEDPYSAAAAASGMVDALGAV